MILTKAINNIPSQLRAFLGIFESRLSLLYCVCRDEESIPIAHLRKPLLIYYENHALNDRSNVCRRCHI